MFGRRKPPEWGNACPVRWKSLLARPRHRKTRVTNGQPWRVGFRGIFVCETVDSQPSNSTGETARVDKYRLLMLTFMVYHHIFGSLSATGGAFPIHAALLTNISNSSNSCSTCFAAPSIKDCPNTSSLTISTRGGSRSPFSAADTTSAARSSRSECAPKPIEEAPLSAEAMALRLRIHLGTP